MSSSTLQASLLLRPPLYTSSFHRPLFSSSSSSSLRFHPQSLSGFYRLSSILLSSRFRPLPCSLRQDNVASGSDLLPKGVFSESRSGDSGGGVTDSAENRVVSDTEAPEVKGLGMTDKYVGDEGTIEATLASETKSEGGDSEVSTGVTEGKEEDQKKKSKFKIVVLLMGLWAAIKRTIEKVMEWEWLSWWPFSRQEKRLEKLIAEADANPKDAALQGALLAELNKHMYAVSLNFD